MKLALSLVAVSIANYNYQTSIIPLEKKMKSKIRNSKEVASSLNKRPSI